MSRKRRPAAPRPRPAVPTARPQERSRRTLLPVLVAGVACVIVLAVAVAAVVGRPPDAPPVSTAGAAEAIPCEPIEHLAYHAHAHLNIRVDGELQSIPDDVGNAGTCLFWLHTHAAHGVIHVEAPTRRVYTLGQFFDVWGQPLTADRVGDRALRAGESIYVFLDRVLVSVDARSIELTDLLAIELQVGQAPLEPLPYTFPDEFR